MDPRSVYKYFVEMRDFRCKTPNFPDMVKVYTKAYNKLTYQEQGEVSYLTWKETYE